MKISACLKEQGGLEAGVGVREGRGREKLRLQPSLGEISPLGWFVAVELRVPCSVSLWFGRAVLGTGACLQGQTTLLVLDFPAPRVCFCQCKHR